MELIQLTIKGISYSQVQTGAYALILQEKERKKKLPIIIGSFEAQSIALALEKDIQSPRPLTHDLFVSFAKEFNIEVSYVVIYKLEDGVFYSNIVFRPVGTNKEIFIDSRTSDAIAIAIRFNALIYTSKEIIDKAGIELELEDMDADSLEDNLKEENVNNYSKSIKELEEEISIALEQENYEKAAKLRDEIERKKLS